MADLENELYRALKGLLAITNDYEPSGPYEEPWEAEATIFLLRVYRERAKDVLSKVEYKRNIER